jgi:hypothetical protein
MWMTPWVEVVNAAALEEELRREVAAGHLLFGLPVTAVARRRDCDDVLFKVLDGTNRYAVVHLTWRGCPGNDPRWPWVTFQDRLQFGPTGVEGE